MTTHSHQLIHDLTHHCGCCPPARPTPMARRRFLSLSSAALGAGIMAGWALPVTAGNTYDAMLINCIDPRLTTEHFNAIATLDGKDRSTVADNYSHFVIAGGALGAIHPAFSKWHDTFWENLAISVQLHKISRVVGLTHRDCGAARIALGDKSVSDRSSESRSHGHWLREFDKAVRERHSQLKVVTGIIDFDGSIEKISG